MNEQLPQYDLMVREYERSANVTYPDDLKIASVIAALPATLRLHAQMTLQDDTTFEDLRQRIEMYEQVSQRWMSDGAVQMNVKPLMDQEDRGLPMEVDAVWAKGGKKGGKKGKKGKEKGKNSKGKSFWSKDGGKKGGKGGKLRAQGSKMEEKARLELGRVTTAASQGTLPENVGPPREHGRRSGGLRGQQEWTVQPARKRSSSTWWTTYRAGVRRVRLVTPTGLATMEIFDLTQDDSPEEPVPSEDEEMAWAIKMVKEVQSTASEEKEIFYDSHSGDEVEPPGTPSLEETGDQVFRAQYEDIELGMCKVCMVKSEAPTVTLPLNVEQMCPLRRRSTTRWVPGQQRSVQMVDAQRPSRVLETADCCFRPTLEVERWWNSSSSSCWESV